MSTEAPEGIVRYSISGVGNGLSPSKYGTFNSYSIPGTTHTGYLIGVNAYIDTSDVLGANYINSEKLVLTDTLIETLDLISEGEIEGPLSGQWILSGNLGQTGWSTAYFSGYSVPTGNESLRWLRSVYWNQLPVLSDAGQFNFQSIDLAYTAGFPNGDTLQTLNSQETTSRPIGTRLYAGDENAQVYRVLNPNCKGTIINIKIQSLSNTEAATGNIRRTNIQWQASYRPLFSTVNKNSGFNPPYSRLIFGKLTSVGSYIDSLLINFDLTSFLLNGNTPVQDTVGFLNDPDFLGWEVRVVRLTADSNSALIVNETFIDSITELYGSSLSYPNSAIVRCLFDSKFFSQVPNRGFECNFIKVNVPSNYNPILRTYATTGYGTTNGYWNGTFSSGKSWTNNPAWCFYDLVTNTRYGLGKFVNNLDVYKFDLYQIAQYCDELVSDGYGRLEPRFTCNAWIAQKDDAYKVINDMASIFRGMTYYLNGNLYVTQDAPKSSRFIFTNANVENGDFNYSSTSKKTRQSVAIVRYNDPKNFYSPAIEYVEDLDSIRRYGVREIQVAAFGCTSRGQAIRLGRWMLYTNNLETETVTFNAGLEANLLKCGDIFEVSDINRKIKRYGGRIWNLNNISSGAVLTLDSPVDLQTGVQYNISVVTPSYYYDPTQVSGLTSNDYNNIYKSFIQSFNFSGDNSFRSGDYQIVNLPTGLDSTNYNISGNLVWSIELGVNSTGYTGNFYFSNKQNDLYRVINTKELEINKYEIIGLSYSPSKFSQIDSGLILQQNQIVQYNSVPDSPDPFLGLTAERTYNGIKYVVDYYLFAFSAANVTNFKVYVTTGNFIGNSVPDNGYLIATLPSTLYKGVFLPQSSGKYTFRVYSFNSTSNYYSTGFSSGYIYVDQGLPILDVSIGGLILN